MTFLLDTDICSFAMKRRFAALQDRLVHFDSGELKVSAATEYELHVGALKAGKTARLRGAINEFLSLESKNTVRISSFRRADRWASPSTVPAY